LASTEADQPEPRARALLGSNLADLSLLFTHDAAVVVSRQRGLVDRATSTGVSGDALIANARLGFTVSGTCRQHHRTGTDATELRDHLVAVSSRRPSLCKLRRNRRDTVLHEWRAAWASSAVRTVRWVPEGKPV
jgi:hypothetical protein